jgi:hypothetical protein
MTLLSAAHGLIFGSPRLAVENDYIFGGPDKPSKIVEAVEKCTDSCSGLFGLLGPSTAVLMLLLLSSFGKKNLPPLLSLAHDCCHFPSHCGCHCGLRSEKNFR